MSSLGKLVEAFVRNSSLEEIDAKGGFHENQYGSWRGRSNTHHVTRYWKKKWLTLITLDVKIAFNTASNSQIIEQLRRIDISKYLIKIISNYLEGRQISISKNDRLDIKAGILQC